MHAGMVLAKGKHMNLEKTDEKKPATLASFIEDDSTMRLIESQKAMFALLAKRRHGYARKRQSGLDKLRELQAVVVNLPPEHAPVTEAIKILAEIVESFLQIDQLADQDYHLLG